MHTYLIRWWFEKNVNNEYYCLYLSIGQPGIDGSKGEKGLSIKGEPGNPGRPGYILFISN